MKTKQTGFTLIELMIGMTIAMIVLSGAGGLFVSTLKANARNVSIQKMDQTLRALNDVMSAEIRRAGYTKDDADTTSESLVASNQCVTFSHYVSKDATEHFYGYRQSGGAIYVRKDLSTSLCSSALTAWDKVTDEAIIKVTNLSFTGNPVVVVVIEAELVGVKTSTGTTVARKIESTVKVRNS